MVKFVPVKELPDLVSKTYRKEYKSLNLYLKRFLDMGVKYARVLYEDHDCTNVYSLKGSFQQAIRRNRYPIKLSASNNELYFIRTDMEG